MSRLILLRTAAVTAAAAAAALAAATPAAADVTIDPPSAPQGSGVNLTFRVTNDTPAAITRVRLELPADTPVAEVYPLSADDWAPRISQRTLDTPLESLHGGAPVTEATKDITWFAAPGYTLTPGASTDLTVALGPLPAELSAMRFTVIPTYADGTTGAAMPPATLTLTPADPAAAGGSGHGHGGATTNGGSGSVGDGGSGGTSAAEEAAFEAIVAQAESGGPGGWALAGWAVAGLAVLGAAVTVARGRRQGPPPDPDATDTPPATPPGPAATDSQTTTPSGPATDPASSPAPPSSQTDISEMPGRRAEPGSGAATSETATPGSSLAASQAASPAAAASAPSSAPRSSSSDISEMSGTEGERVREAPSDSRTDDRAVDVGPAEDDRAAHDGPAHGAPAEGGRADSRARPAKREPAAAGTWRYRG